MPKNPSRHPLCALLFAPSMNRRSIREDSSMERFIANLVRQYESGAVDRREFCQTVALAATVYAAGDAAQAQTRSGFKVLAVNHFGYTCPDYTKSRDFYTSVFGLENLKETSGRANLGFGPAPG